MHHTRWLLLTAAAALSCGDAPFSPSDDASTGGGTPDPTTSDVSESGSSVGDDATSSSSSGTSPPDSSSSSSSSSDESSSSGAPSRAAGDDLYRTPMEVALDIGASDGLFANDSAPLTLVDADAVSERGGSVTVQDDGAFTYAPPPGDWGTDRFGYTVVDAAGAMWSAVVSVNITPVAIALSEIAADHGGFSVDGPSSGAGVGWTVAAAGDVDGDAITDLVLGSWRAADLGDDAYLVFGHEDPSHVELDDVVASGEGFTIGAPIFPFSTLAVGAVRGAGDVDGDGLGDVIVAGAGTYVVLGKADAAAVDLAAVVEGDGGFLLEDEPVDQYSRRFVDGVGDMNADGLDDVVMSVSAASETGQARVYVVFGKVDTEPVDLAEIAEGNGGFAVEGEAPADGSSAIRSVSAAGDVNGDAIPDIVIGNSLATPGGVTGAGRVYVVFGKADTEPVDLALLTEGGGFVVDGAAQDTGFARLGHAVSGAGDVDGDGLDDVVVSANGVDRGRSYVVFGKADGEPVAQSSLETGDGGFAIRGEALGLPILAVGGGGDVNGDGRADVVVGQYYNGFAEDPPIANRAYVVYGRSETEPVDLADVASGDGGFALLGEPESDGIEYMVDIPGDLDGDGLTDILLGANATTVDGVFYVGRTYVVFGVSTAPHR